MTNNVIHNNVQQWKYTHCQYNQGSGAGFFTYAMSTGLSKEDEADLKSFAGSYLVPSHIPSESKNEPAGQILHLFPVAFSAFRLQSGKRAITRTRYVGKNYDDRKGGGNFFVHGLILPEGDWDFYPTDLCWDDKLWLPVDNPPSRIWFDGLKYKEEQNIGRVPPPLPSVEIREEHIKRFTSYDFDKLFDIKNLLSKADRFEQFKALFAAMQNSSEKPVLLRDKPENIAAWIAAIQYALPISVSQNITFTTYCNSDERAKKFNIVGTSFEGSVLKLDSPNYSGFDFDKGTMPVQSTDTPYLQILTAEEFPGMNVDKCWEFAKNNEIKISPFDGTADNLVLLNEFIRGRIDLGNSSRFDATWTLYTKLSEDLQQRLLGNFLSGTKHCPMAYLLRVVPHFENMIDLAPPDSDIKNSFTTWVVKQCGANFKDHSREVFALLDNLKHKIEYAEILLTSGSIGDHPVLDEFLSLFVDGERRLNPRFVTCVIQQFATSLDESLGGPKYKTYLNDVKTMFQDERRKQQLFPLFCKTLREKPQKEHLLFHLGLLLSGFLPDIKKVDEEMKQIASFLGSQSLETQTAFLALVHKRVFLFIEEPQMKYLLFENFLEKKIDELPHGFAQTLRNQDLQRLLEGCRKVCEAKSTPCDKSPVIQ